MRHERKGFFGSAAMRVASESCSATFRRDDGEDLLMQNVSVLLRYQPLRRERALLGIERAPKLNRLLVHEKSPKSSRGGVGHGFRGRVEKSASRRI